MVSGTILEYSSQDSGPRVCWSVFCRCRDCMGYGPGILAFQWVEWKTVYSLMWSWAQWEHRQWSVLWRIQIGLVRTHVKERQWLLCVSFFLCFIHSALVIFLGWLLGHWRRLWMIQCSHFSLGHKIQLHDSWIVLSVPSCSCPIDFYFKWLLRDFMMLKSKQILNC